MKQYILPIAVVLGLGVSSSAYAACSAAPQLFTRDQLTVMGATGGNPPTGQGILYFLNDSFKNGWVGLGELYPVGSSSNGQIGGKYYYVTVDQPDNNTWLSTPAELVQAGAVPVASPAGYLLGPLFYTCS
jgi:hypothetical protein